MTTASDGKNYDVTNAQMEKMVEKVYQQFDANRKIKESQQADIEDLQDFKTLEEEVKSRMK